MSKKVSLSDMYPIIQEMLDKDGTATIKVSGFSMQPMVYNLRDTVTLKKPDLPLKKNDLPLYRMDDGRFVMHRVVKVYKDGTYKCQGDNCWVPEDNIRNDQIIGVVKAFNRNGKHVDCATSRGYKLYIFYIRHSYYLRYLWKKIIRPTLGKIKRFIIEPFCSGQ